MATVNKKTQTIDLTPTWQEQSTAIRMLLQNAKTKEAQEAATKELIRMAKVADIAVAALAALKEIRQRLQDEDAVIAKEINDIVNTVLE